MRIFTNRVILIAERQPRHRCEPPEIAGRLCFGYRTRTGGHMLEITRNRPYDLAALKLGERRRLDYLTHALVREIGIIPTARAEELP